MRGGTVSGNRVVVAVVHGAWGTSLDEEDTREQARCVCDSLTRLGMAASIVALGPELRELAEVATLQPQVVFNLVEGLGGLGRRAHEAANHLASLGVPLTGVNGPIQEVVNSKIAGKEALHRAGLPTPPWSRDGSDISGDDLWIVKPVWEHGSLAMDASSVVPADQVARVLARRARESQHLHFAEKYIPGREFNVSIVQSPRGGEVFPPVEMLFVDYPDDALKIVDYAAKWDATSFGYHHTPRRFVFPERDRPLLRRLHELSLAVWDHFDMTGYVRVDFRVDDRNQPWILEINANPCLSPEAGFVVTVLQSGLTYDQLIERLVRAALGWPEEI